jgi:hypothetical protein
VFIVRPEIEDTVREHVRSVVGDVFPTEFVAQTLDDLPEGFRSPPDRNKPWGTAHAVLCAAPRVSGPFAVCNADDLYGTDAFHQLLGYLSGDPPLTEAAMVGYTLADTLSGSGGVARGICVLGKDHLLESVTEIGEIRQVDGWISGVDPDGESVELNGTEIVSMNLWGFSDPVVEALRRQFRRFLDRWGSDTDAEFPLSTAVSTQVQTGSVRVAVLPGRGDWFGVTHAEDREQAEATLRERVEAGQYPRSLATAFAGMR